MRAVLCLIISLCLGSVSALFDCARGTGECQNGGTCNLAAGTCSCDAPYTGYDCSVVVADESHADCTLNPCQNSGTCHKSATATAVSCLCTPEYTGATCTISRNTLTCDTTANPNTMTMKVTPHVRLFAGKVYLKGKEGTCDFTAGSGGYERVALAVDDANCGATASGTNNVQEVIIQFGADTLTTNDEVITFTCATSDTVEQTSGSITIQNVDSNLGATAVGNALLDTDVALTLMSGGTTASGATLDLGADIILTASLTTAGATKFTALRLTRCYAANYALSTETGYKTLDFITNSCPAADLKSIMLTPVTGGADTKTFTFDAFKITGTSNDIFVTCLIKPCEVATDCDPVTCGAKRRKRDAGASQVKVLQRSFNINDPLTSVTAAAVLNEFKEDKACYLTWEMTATVVALSVALLLLLILCIVLVVKAILNRRTTVSRDDTSDNNSTAHLPHLPTLVSNKC